jgi:predicted Zn-dependent protease with MMP-like domain
VATSETDWARVSAPSLAEFERLAEEAFARLPGAFRHLCYGLVLRVSDFPDRETLEEMRCESAFDLLGLFRGVGLAQGGGAAFLQTGQMPNMVWLYRRPILDYWAEHEEALGSIITHVLVHEVGHHFGLSDADMEGIEAAADDSEGRDGSASTAG